MIGMSFESFVVLLVLSVVVSAVLHYGVEFYATPGFTSFLSKVTVGYIGAWLGAPVFGSWFEQVKVGSVYIIPAALGACAILVVAIDVVQMFKGGGGNGRRRRR